MMLRQAAKEILRKGQYRPLTSSAAALQATKKPAKKADDDTFELLPPGCSIADPSYGHSLSDPVLIYDQNHEDEEEYKPFSRRGSKGKAVPAAPTSRAAAQAKLDEKKKAAETDEPYVYLPPGSSMRDPGYTSVSDPQDRALGRRVYYRDPSPMLRK